MSNVDLNVKYLDSITAIHVADNLRENAEYKQNGTIKIGSKTYQVSYVGGGEGGQGEFQVKRHYTGFFIGRFLNWVNKNNLSTQTGAVNLKNKINEIMQTKTYALVKSNYDKLMAIAQAHGKGDIEVANYGHKEPRNIVKGEGVLEAVNARIAKEGKNIRFNKIDDYNTNVGITTLNMLPSKYSTLMQDIAGQKLTVDEERLDSGSHAMSKESVQDWLKFIAKPENIEKIDIPRKLFKMMNQDKNAAGAEGLKGWKQDFSMDPDLALKKFVIKNMGFRYKNASQETIAMLAGKLKDYVNIYNMEDGPDKTDKLNEFFKLKNWPHTQKEVESFKEGAKSYAKENNITDPTGSRSAYEQTEEGRLHVKSYEMFTNMLMMATFRQTSKLGLEFFRQQNTPVLFQTTDLKHRDIREFALNDDH
ncbi:MAG: hypothetical protein J6I40_08360, partial [Mailhella sp.]|nr:hypothetical protein [Mailhella sp.]